MDKLRAQKMYELANRLSQVDRTSLSESQHAEYTAMLEQLQAEAVKMKQGVAEGWDDMINAVNSKHAAQSSGNSGVKHGRAYGSGEDEDDEELGYFNDKEQKTHGPRVSPNPQNRSHRIWSGKTPARIPFDESTDTRAYDRLKRVFDFSDYKG
jgi:hypothetical protein